MLHRVVRRCDGSGTTADADNSGYVKSRTPEELLRQAQASSIAGVLGQLATVSAYAFDIFTELKDDTAALAQSFERIHGRVDAVAVALASDSQRDAWWTHPALSQLPSAAESDSVLQLSEANDSFIKRSAALQAAYEACEEMPPLELLDELCSHETTNAGEPSCRTKYSHPGFFREEWVTSEALRHQVALAAKQERRKLEKGRAQLPAAQAATSSVSEIKDDNEQKRLKFLRIRPWREIYGTGEGRELMQAPQDPSKNPSLLSQTRKAKKTVSAPTSEQIGGIPPPLTISVPEKCQPLTSSQPETPTTIVCSGAFMQEMDEDEMNESDSAIVHEMDAMNGYQPRQSSTSDSGEPQEFADHGLSYYDPRQTCSPPPPPPPPPPPLPDFTTVEQELQDPIENEPEYYDVSMEADFDQPPPPPPPPSPPLPPSETIGSNAPPTNFLHEIQRGASLRHIQSTTETEPATESSQMSLLQQIKLKQSRLRHIEPQVPRKQSLPTGPFANSIARILERRASIGYDSDSSDSQKSSEDNDW